MLSWYPLEITLPLLALAGIILLGRAQRKGRGQNTDIWQKNAGGFLIFLALLHFLFVPQIFTRLASGYSTNVAQTSSSPPLPELAPPIFAHPPDTTFSAALAAADRLKHFDIVTADAEILELTLTVGIPAWGWWPRGLHAFTDDMTVSIAPARAGSQLHMRSASRVGFADLGENRRHIVQFGEAVGEELVKIHR